MPTTHVAYAEDIAILVGDGLLALAFRVIAEGRGADAETRLALAHFGTHTTLPAICDVTADYEKVGGFIVEWDD